MKIILVVFLFLTLLNRYEMYKQMIKIKKGKTELFMSFSLLILTVVI